MTSSNENQRWMFNAVETLALEQGEAPATCGPYEAIVCPKRTGLCGSDMHIYLKGLIRGKPFKNPFVLGHETSGLVYQVGEKVTSLKVGDRVALEPGEACLRCVHCKTGHYQHCEDMKFAAALGRDGTLQSYYTLPADLCYKLPENITLDVGAVMEPLAVAVQAVAHIAKLSPTSNVAVFGAGPVGLLTMAVARAFGARRVIAIDVNAERLEFAKGYAATDIYVACGKQAGEDMPSYTNRNADTLRSELSLESDDIDVVFECTGAEPCIQTGMLLLKRRGTMVQVGNSAPFANIPMLTIINRELTVKGSFRYGPGAFKLAIDLVSRGLVAIEPLITHSYSWEDAVKAFTTTGAAKGPDGKMAIKVLIKGPGE